MVGVGSSAGATFVQTPPDAQLDNLLRSANDANVDVDVELTAFSQVVALQVSSNARDK